MLFLCIIYFTLILSILVSELVREVDRDDEVDSRIVEVDWEGIDRWSDGRGLFKEDISNDIEDEISVSGFNRVELIIWRFVSQGISIWGSSFIFSWSKIWICSFNGFSDVNKAKIY